MKMLEVFYKDYGNCEILEFYKENDNSKVFYYAENGKRTTKRSFNDIKKDYANELEVKFLESEIDIKDILIPIKARLIER